MNKLSPIPIADVQLARNQVIFREQYASLNDADKIPNSVQHNVPAWTMFAIFFITISLAGNIIKERDDGSFTRLCVMPCPYPLYLLSKIAVYLVVCLLQFICLLLLGIYLFPLLGLPALEINGRWFALLLMCFSSALAAIGYGILIGKLSATHQQAAIFASISTVILAAIGGVWIPVFVMPPLMQIFSRISPLNWGLEGFYDVFVRQNDIFAILPECGVSILFAVICVGGAIFYDKRNRAKLQVRQPAFFRPSPITLLLLQIRVFAIITTLPNLVIVQKEGCLFRCCLFGFYRCYFPRKHAFREEQTRISVLV